MATQSSPVITDMKVIPVAGHDSMLLNIGGAHNAYFTRNIVVLTDNAGHTGIGEAPGGEVIYQTLVKAIPMVLGQEVARLNKVVQQVHKGNQAADFDTFGKGAWTFELRVNAVAALEAVSNIHKHTDINVENVARNAVGTVLVVGCVRSPEHPEAAPKYCGSNSL